MNPQWLQQGLALHQAGRLAQAEPLYQQFLSLAPADYAALHLMGLLRLQQGRLPEALALMEKALQVRPGAPDTLANYASVLSALGRGNEALAALATALVAQPRNSLWWGNGGAIKSRLGRPNEALADLDQALALDPRNLDALLNRGLVLQVLERSGAALENFDTLLLLLPGHTEAIIARGVSLQALGRLAEALLAFDQVIVILPRHAGAHLNRASLLWQMERLDDALQGYGDALAIEPENLGALESRASLLWTRLQALAPAIADLEKLILLAPHQAYVLGDLLQLKMHAGDWQNFDGDLARLETAMQAGHPAVQPFVYQGLSQSPADLLACASAYAARLYPAHAPVHKPAPRRAGRLRIGYVCGEFRAQATMYLAAGLFENHDRALFEIIGFDNGRDDHSPMRARVVAGFDRFISIALLSDADAAALIAAQDIDILVNLNGYFGKMRMGVFAHRPAPIQVNYLGFPGTLGADYMDYILADGVLIAPQDEIHYREQVARLPHSYQVNDDARALVVSSRRDDHGLPPHAFVFCHFNYGYKITPDLFACWMRILKAADGSVLWLLAGDRLFAQNLAAQALRHGVDPARLIFAPPLELQAHLARLPLADLFLDSLISNAHTTASDALWAGLPLITKRGSAFAGRVGASLLTALGLPEMVSETMQDYETLALELAGDAPRLKAVRAKMENNRRSAPLFDTARTTRHIETAYEEMQARRLRGEAPLSFAVAP